MPIKVYRNMAQIDPRLIHKMNSAGDREKIKAILSLVTKSRATRKGLGSEKRMAEALLKHTEDISNEKLTSVQQFPRLGVVVIEGTPKLLRILLKEPEISSATISEDDFTRLFWDRLCQIYRYRKTNRPDLRDFAVDGITKTEGLVIDREKGYLGVGGTGQREAERRLRGFADEGLVQIDDLIYRLTSQGEQFCASRPPREA